MRLIRGSFGHALATPEEDVVTTFAKGGRGTVEAMAQGASELVRVGVGNRRRRSVN